MILVRFFGCCDTVIRSRYVRPYAVYECSTRCPSPPPSSLKTREREREEFLLLSFGFVHLSFAVDNVIHCVLKSYRISFLSPTIFAAVFQTFSIPPKTREYKT